MTTEQAKASEKVIAGTILVHSIPVISLFDSGASHCYISSLWCILYPVMIWIPNGRLVPGTRL